MGDRRTRERTEPSKEYNWLPQVPFLGLLGTPGELANTFAGISEGEYLLGLSRAKPRVRGCRPLSQLLQEPKETRSQDKPEPNILLNAALESWTNLKVQKAQDVWSEASNPARVEGQEKPALKLSVIGGHNPHYLLHNSTAFPVDLSKPKFFCS